MGLQPRAVSRDLEWGIPVPVEGAEGKVLYVWFDAPIGYISNTKDLLPNDWEKWWKSDDTKLVHFIGKDNIVFHCIVFPAMLKAEGSYILPENVPSNEFLNLEDDKISTSRNWAVWLHEYLVDFPGKQDVLRYVLTANAPETKDNNFTWADFQARNNNELVAVYGNFVNRALQLTKKYYDGVVPACGEITEFDQATIDEFRGIKAKVEALLEGFRFRDALKEAMNMARIGNKYIADCGLIILDDMMYAPISPEDLPMLYRAITFLNETRSFIVITNREMSGWTDAAEDTHLMQTIVDRLTSNSQILRFL